MSWMALASCSAARCPARSSSGSTSLGRPMICGGATSLGGGARPSGVLGMRSVLVLPRAKADAGDGRLRGRDARLPATKPAASKPSMRSACTGSSGVDVGVGRSAAPSSRENRRGRSGWSCRFGSSRVMGSPPQCSPELARSWGAQ